MKVSLIMAVSENRVIGRCGELPWHLPADLRHFKRLTVGHTLVMGRRTFESIGRPLPKRRSVVLSRHSAFSAPGVSVARDLEQALTVAARLEREAVGEGGEVFVIGGAAVFAAALPRAERIYLTLVHADVEGDVFLPSDLPCPPWNGDDWSLESDERHPADERHEHAFSFRLYERSVLTCGQIDRVHLEALLDRYGLDLVFEDDGAEIPGSHWGAPEAGLVGRRVHVRGDTPVHSLLHETGHVVCMDQARRRTLHTDAGEDEKDGDLEESGVCFLQIVLADEIPGVGRRRLMRDMDLWGYSFRLGSTRAWFEDDAEDARRWLVRKGLIDADGRPTWALRR